MRIDAEKVLTIKCATGDMEVPCFPSGVDGLVIHPAPGYEELQTPLWVLTHEASGFAIAKDYFLLGKGEARLVAAGLAGLTDWTQPVDGSVDVEAVRRAFDNATAWRDIVSQSVRDLVWGIGDDVIVEEPSDPCDGKWHRIDFGWGKTYVSLATSRPGNPTVLHFGASRVIASARRVWSYEVERYRCLDCGLDV